MSQHHFCPCVCVCLWMCVCASECGFAVLDRFNSLMEENEGFAKMLVCLQSFGAAAAASSDNIPQIVCGLLIWRLHFCSYVWFVACSLCALSLECCPCRVSLTLRFETLSLPYKFWQPYKPLTWIRKVWSVEGESCSLYMVTYIARICFRSWETGVLTWNRSELRFATEPKCVSWPDNMVSAYEC